MKISRKTPNKLSTSHPVRVDMPPQSVHMQFRCGMAVVRIRTTRGGRGAEIEIMHPRDGADVKRVENYGSFAKTIVRVGDARQPKVEEVYRYEEGI